MKAQPAEEPRNVTAIWEELAKERIMEPTEAPVIVRSLARRLFGTFYEYLGSLLLLNLLVVVQLGVGGAIGFGLAAALRLPVGAALVLLVLGGAVAAGPAWAGLFSYVRTICDDESLPSVREYWRGMRRFAVRSWILLAIQLLSGGLLVLNIRFYTSVHGVAGQAIVLLLLFVALVWAMAGLYAWPLLVRDVEWRVLLRNTVLLAIVSPFSTIVVLFCLSAVSALLVVSRIGWALALFSIWALTANVMLQRLLRIVRARQEGASQSQ